MTTPYACYRDMLYELKADESDANAPDIFNGLQFLKTSTLAIFRKLHIRFQPFIETKQYDPSTWAVDSHRGILVLPETVFQLIYVTDGDGNTIDPSRYTTLPALVNPFSIIQLSPGKNAPYTWYKTTGPAYPYSSDASIKALWGWHNDYSHAWSDTLDTVQDSPLNVGSSIITVQDVDGSDIYGRSPRFSPGQLIKIDNEFVEVTATDSDLNTLTVLRASNGTDPDSHVNGSSIKVWDVPYDIKQAITRYACYPYKRRGDYRKNETDGMGGNIQLPESIPGDVLSLLQAYANGIPS